MRKPLVLAFALSLAVPALAAGPSGYHTARTLAAGGDGGWDYVTFDPEGKRLFVTRGTRVDVVDPASGKVVGEIPNTAGVHGVALDGAGTGFTSNGRAGTVTVFDAKTLAVKREVKVTGENPDAILYEPATKRVFTFNGRSANATAIDAATLEVAGTIAFGGKPEFPVTDGKGTVWVNIEDKGELVAFDPKTLTVKKRVALTGCEEPTGLAMDVEAGRLFSGCGNGVLAVTDAAAGKLLQTVAIGRGCDGVVFDAGLVFTANGEGTVTVIRRDGEKYAAVENVPTQKSARTIAVDPKTHELFLPAARFGPAPAATAENPRPRPAMEKGSFVLLVLGR